MKHQSLRPRVVADVCEGTKTLLLGHADEPELLALNIAHHFAVGFDHIVVVTERADAAARDVVARFDPQRAFHYVLQDRGGDLFNFFSRPARFAAVRLGTAWIAVCDTDEFIVARAGTIGTTPAMRRYDLVALPRFTVLPQGDDADRLVPFDLSRPQRLPIAAEYFDIKDAWLSGDRSMPYVLGKDAPKILARACVTDGVLPGGHGIVTTLPFATRGIDDDLAIVHVPFSTLPRFERKIAAIRDIFAHHADRFGPEDAWHWRSWVALDAAGVRREFEAQIRPPQGPGVAETAETIFARSVETPPPANPAAFAQLKTMVHCVAPIVRREMPGWIDIVFDLQWYLDHNDDVRDGVARDALDPRAHFFTTGIAEGRSPCGTFDPHFVRGELERRTENFLELRDVYWLYFSLPESDRPPTLAPG